MTTKEPKTRPQQYGCAPDYSGPAPAVLMRSDCRGEYRRPSVNLRTGEIVRDAQGAIVYDVAPNISTRGHRAMIAKNWELVRVTEYDRPERELGGTAA